MGPRHGLGLRDIWCLGALRVQGLEVWLSGAGTGKIRWCGMIYVWSAGPVQELLPRSFDIELAACTHLPGSFMGNKTYKQFWPAWKTLTASSTQSREA